MKPKILTPLEILQKQKIDLQIRADILTGSIENHAKYLQQHFVPLLRDSVLESVVSKTPPQIQNILSRFFHNDGGTHNITNSKDFQDSTIGNFLSGIAISMAEIVPVFLKGRKGVFLSVLVKLIFKWVRI